MQRFLKQLDAAVDGLEDVGREDFAPVVVERIGDAAPGVVITSTSRMPASINTLSG